MRIDETTSCKLRVALIATLLCCVNTEVSAQRFFVPADSLNVKRVLLVAGSSAAVYGTALVGLNTVWYQQYERGGFHTFNDWPEWNQMDKAGHAWTAYTEARWTSKALRWSGVKPNTADAVAVGTAMLFQTTLEMMDAYSVRWGFSWSDIGANAAGAGLFYAQSQLWDEQRVAIKFSSYPVRYKQELEYTDDVSKRVNELYGTSTLERTVKDYNGQTYWLSINPSSFSNNDFRPRWLSVAIGYGAGGMLGGRENTWTDETGSHNYSTVPRTRQFYLSPDIDFTRIQTNSPFLKTIFELISVVKFPAPALMLDNTGSVKFFPVYF